MELCKGNTTLKPSPSTEDPGINMPEPKKWGTGIVTELEEPQEHCLT
jgi:hypothetical protein